MPQGGKYAFLFKGKNTTCHTAHGTWCLLLLWFLKESQPIKELSALVSYLYIKYNLGGHSSCQITTYFVLE
jgi:hypothetical protein